LRPGRMDRCRSPCRSRSRCSRSAGCSASCDPHLPAVRLVPAGGGRAVVAAAPAGWL
jgi:hypothetical protein